MFEGVFGELGFAVFVEGLAPAPARARDAGNVRRKIFKTGFWQTSPKFTFSTNCKFKYSINNNL